MGKARRGSLDTKLALNQLREGRAGAITVLRGTKIGGPEYKTATEVTFAIDNLAELLTGDPAHFHVKMHSASTLEFMKDNER